MIASTAFVGRCAAGSCVLGTSRLRSVPLESVDGSLSSQVFARPYVRLRRVLAGGSPGRVVGRAGEWAGHSVFRTGQWTRLVGGCLLGVAAGRAIQGAILAPAFTAVVGLALVLWGPMLVNAARDSMILGSMISAWRGDGGVSRGASRPDADERKPWVLASGVLVCIASGAVSGLSARFGPVWLAAGVLGAIAVVAVLWRPETILLAAAAFPWLDSLAREHLGALGAAWDESLLLAALALLLWGAVVTGRLRLRTVPIAVPVLLVLAVSVGSIVVRGVPTDVGLFGLRVTLEPILFYFLGFLLCSSTGWSRRTVTVFLASTTGLALHGLYQFVTRVPTPTRWVDASETSIVTRAFSVIGNPNGLGSVLAVGSLVGIALLLSPALRRGPRIALVMVVAVQLGGLAVTFSRGAWLGMACGVFALLVLAYRRYLLPASLAVVVGVFAAPRVIIDRFLHVFSAEYLGIAAVDGRIYRWMAALDQIAAHPWFGLGLGTFGGSSAARFGYWDTWVDNFYLQLGAEGGLLLLVAFLWLMLRVAKGLVKGARVAADPFVSALSAGVFAALVAVAVASVFASVLEILAVGSALWLLAGVSTGMALRRKDASEE